MFCPGNYGENGDEKDKKFRHSTFDSSKKSPELQIRIIFFL